MAGLLQYKCIEVKIGHLKAKATVGKQILTLVCLDDA